MLEGVSFRQVQVLVQWKVALHKKGVPTLDRQIRERYCIVEKAAPGAMARGTVFCVKKEVSFLQGGQSPRLGVWSEEFTIMSVFLQFWRWEVQGQG